MPGMEAEDITVLLAIVTESEASAPNATSETI